MARSTLKLISIVPSVLSSKKRCSMSAMRIHRAARPGPRIVALWAHSRNWPRKGTRRKWETHRSLSIISLSATSLTNSQIKAKLNSSQPQSQLILARSGIAVRFAGTSTWQARSTEIFPNSKIRAEPSEWVQPRNRDFMTTSSKFSTPSRRQSPTTTTQPTHSA